MTPDTLVVLTGRSPKRIIREGGSGAWALDQSRAKRCKYLICAQNRNAGGWSDATETHGSAFLIGTIFDVISDSDRPERFKVLIDRFSLLNIQNFWDGSRNPVRYASLEESGIDPETVEFLPMPEFQQASPEALEIGTRPLTIKEAKEGLALALGIAPEAIEITIRA